MNCVARALALTIIAGIGWQRIAARRARRHVLGSLMVTHSRLDGDDLGRLTGLSAGRVYAALRRLEDDGHVRGEWTRMQPGFGPSCYLWDITPSGVLAHRRLAP